MNLILNVLVFYFGINSAISTPSGPDLCPTIITKRSWGGQTANGVTYTATPLDYVIIHHTATPECLTETDCSRRLVNMQHYHMNDMDYDDITYNFLIASDGQVYEGVGWHKAGSHSPGWNTKSIGIAFIGDFRTKSPNQKMLKAAKSLITCAVELGELRHQHKLLGARSVKKTESPGGALYREIQKWRGFTRTP